MSSYVSKATCILGFSSGNFLSYEAHKLQRPHSLMTPRLSTLHYDTFRKVPDPDGLSFFRHLMGKHLIPTSLFQKKSVRTKRNFRSYITCSGHAPRSGLPRLHQRWDHIRFSSMRERLLNSAHMRTS